MPTVATTGAIGVLQFATTKAALAQGMTSSTFNFADMRDLWVRVTVSSLPDHAATIQHLTFINPLGEVFYQDNAAYSSDPTITTTQMPSMMYPSQVFPATGVSGGFALDRDIPIAGSVFQRFPSDGDWTVTASVDGAAGTLQGKFTVANHR